MIQYLFMSNEQTHPLHTTDKIIIDSLITKEEPKDQGDDVTEGSNGGQVNDLENVRSDDSGFSEEE